MTFLLESVGVQLSGHARSLARPLLTRVRAGACWRWYPDCLLSSSKKRMTEPWDLIENDDYKTWLKKRQITEAVYNDLKQVSAVDRSTLVAQFEKEQLPPPSTASPPAYELKLTIIRNNRQADGLRKILTQFAQQRAGFYPIPTGMKTIGEMHDMAFMSAYVPGSVDLSNWPQEQELDGEVGPSLRLLSVHLLFLDARDANAFKGEVLQLLKLRPSTRLMNADGLSLLSPLDVEEGIQVELAKRPSNPRGVLEDHYQSRTQPKTAPNDSIEWGNLTATETASLPPGCVGNFNKSDPLWPHHAIEIETEQSFGLYAEKAHIFPHKECVKAKKNRDGKLVKITTGYEWLDDPSNAEFNFLYLSKNMHASYDGTAGGRAAKTSSQPAICIEPEARTVLDSESGVRMFKVEADSITHESRATIPLRVWCKSKEVADVVQSQLPAGTILKFDDACGLNYFSNITIQCCHWMVPMDPEPEQVLDGDTGQYATIYGKKVPFMDDRLSNAWSLTNDGKLSTTEIMEKCLLWNANETWNSSWASVVHSRDFQSKEA